MRARALNDDEPSWSSLAGSTGGFAAADRCASVLTANTGGVAVTLDNGLVDLPLVVLNTLFG